GPDFQGKGFGKDAMQLVMNYAFNELNLHRLSLTVFGYNQGAIKLYESLGFRHEGTYREFLQRDGKRHDMHLYGLLASDL
ncbi:MAG TPA: GNAT family protein, partial [Paenisporosarcina sp.]|nr:GNAT family protein [Paenisporosarcina sp.]